MAETYSVALAGSGGAGVMTAGTLLLEGAAKAGFYGLMSKLAGSQVRGGEAAALVRLATWRVEGPPDAYDILCAVDWRNVDRFAPEIPLSRSAVILTDPASGPVPPVMLTSGARLIELPLADLAKAIRGGRPAMVAIGVLGALARIPEDAIAAVLPKHLAEHGAAAIDASRAALAAGYRHIALLGLESGLPDPKPASNRWLISGNQALALGALRAGVRFVAGYPITPATEFVEWMSPALLRLGGRLIQGEDELASINLALGASFGGVPAMTVTSGPGFSLMVESVGLAVASETPLVLVDVQRAGPSTGISTKSEQSDLNLAVYGAHGDAPRVVVAPTSVADSLPAMEWAVGLAERLQVPVIVLADQQMGQADAVIDGLPPPAPRVTRLAPEPGKGPYKRYAMTPSGISPIATPGMPGCCWVGEGLTHNEGGAPVTSAKDHVAQIEKRWHKLDAFDFGADGAETDGDGELAIVTWGSSAAPAREAADRLRREGQSVRVVALRLIAPVRPKQLLALLAGARRTVVVELNHRGQLFHYLRSEAALPDGAESLARPGPLPLTAREICARIQAGGHA
ncbi:MAG TPA: 2-oxoacid:acceptor oxidoreductase subunit alpha [Stellaceae bacterium]|nr:2-oxoacid:acceptor oxidoreductase subunit alpha [Stellaceae bacterium]